MIVGQQHADGRFHGRLHLPIWCVNGGGPIGKLAWMVVRHWLETGFRIDHQKFDTFPDADQAEALAFRGALASGLGVEPAAVVAYRQINLVEGPVAIRSRRFAADACRTTLVSASCATRKQATASSAGG